MKKTAKIITIVLSCLLLIGVMVGISVSAAEDTIISIYKKSLSYEGEVKITYALDVQNLGEGEIVKVAFSYEEKAAPTGNIADAGYVAVKGVEGNLAMDGKNYPVVYSIGFEPAMMNKPVYATPVVVDANDNVVAYGATEKFSIFQYCTERFSGSYTDDQYELYTALLGYGASVQDALITDQRVKEVVDTYGYADAYYVVNATVKVDGEVAGTETLCYREADVTLNPAKTYNGKMFAGFEDAEGNAITMYGADKTASTWNNYDTTLEIGANSFTYNYKTAGALQTWTDADGNDITLKGSGLFYPDSNSALNVDSSSSTLVWADVIDGELAIGATNTTSWRPFQIYNKGNVAGAVGKTYVFETDMNINWKNDATTSDTNLFQFAFTANQWYGTEDDFVLFAINRTSATEYKLQCLDGTGGDWANLVTGLKFDKTYNLRIEYKIVSKGTTNKTTPTSSTAIGEVSVYVDGELKSSFTATGYFNSKSNANFYGVGFLDRGYKGTGTHTTYFDNTYIATED